MRSLSVTASGAPGSQEGGIGIERGAGKTVTAIVTLKVRAEQSQCVVAGKQLIWNVESGKHRHASSVPPGALSRRLR